MTAAVAPQTVQRGGLGLSPSDTPRIGVRRRLTPAIAIPAQRPAPAIEQDRTARTVEAVIAFLREDGRAERLLAQPRCGGCIGCRDACPRCVYVTGLARIAVRSAK